ncbi:MAG: hypothetical protein ACRED9_07975 [Caulobacteraceae bacterium]
MQKLLVYQAVWGMESLPLFDLEEDLPAAIDQVLNAGFDGVGVALLRREQSEIVSKVMADMGGTWEATGFVRTAADLKRDVDRAFSLGAHHLNVQILERLDRVSAAVGLLQDMEAVATEAPLPVHYETHRGRLTNDLLFTVRILEELPGLRLTGDLSHYPVVHEMPLPVPAQDLERISQVIEHCWGFHGRVPGSHQVQVSIEAPQHQGWVEQLTSWWREGFASWRRRAGSDGELSFMAELGPPHYAITNADGHELADRWHEAQLLKDMARTIWRDQKGDERA